MLFLLFVLLSLLYDSVPRPVLYNCTLDDVKHPLRFLGFFPCSLDSNRDLHECDMLTLSAVELAIDNINQDPNILSCFKLELLSVFTNDLMQVNNITLWIDLSSLALFIIYILSWLHDCHFKVRFITILSH